MPDDLWAAFALVLIIEGILPFVAPRFWRITFTRLTQLSDGQLRFIGLVSIAAGLIALFSDQLFS
jgi:uncharacterized protein